MAVLGGTPLHCVAVHVVRPAMFQVVEVSGGGGGTISTLHSPTHSPRSWPVQSHCPLKIQQTSQSWNVAGAAFLKSPSLLSAVGLDTIFFFIIIILTFWHLHGKFCDVFQRETHEQVELSTSVLMPALMSQLQQNIRQAASGCTKTAHDNTHGCWREKRGERFLSSIKSNLS